MGHPWVPLSAPVCLTGSNNARHSAASAFSPGCMVLLHGHQSQVQPAVLSLGGGEGLKGGAVSKMQGMRWKVNSDTETEERGSEKGDGSLEAECVISKNERSHLGSSTASLLSVSTAALSGSGLNRCMAGTLAARLGKIDWYTTNWLQPTNPVHVAA